MSNARTPVMVNGLPGKMASEVARKINDSEDFYLYPFALTGPEINILDITIENTRVLLYKPSERGVICGSTDFSSTETKGLVVDFSHPSAMNENADFYCAHGFNFVMGTTGGDKSELEKRVGESDVSAVVAPNMAQPIVSLQAFMQRYSHAYENLLEGCSLSIVESHQKGKADTSGTAKAMVQYFNKLGIPFTTSMINMIRNPESQRALGIPEEHLGGHGWHTYTIQSPNEGDHGALNDFESDLFDEYFNNNPALNGYRKGSVKPYFHAISPDGNVVISLRSEQSGQLSLVHNVNGRSVYADGTLDALKFLKSKIGAKGKVYSMMDVLDAKN